MEEHLIIKVVLIGALGFGSQWLAWRYQLPAIVLLALAGTMAGPVLGLLNPVEDFGPLLQPMISIAVAIILFEGGLNLDFRELRGVSRAVRRLVLVGAPVGWLLGSLAAHYAAGLSWPVAVLFAGILVVTGPTVIIPLLRQAKLSSRPAAVLKWEGIINDPIGALLAVLVYEVVTVSHGDEAIAGAGIMLVAAICFAAALGYSLGKLSAVAFYRGLVPEYLKAPAILCAVLTCFECANLVQEETGLLAVTVLGVTLANSRLASIHEMRRFKENITILLVSAIFVVLSASLPRDVLLSADWRMAAFVGVVLFLVRPLTIWLSTIGSGLSWQERTLIGWIAPRGIVAVAVAGLFGPALVKHGYEDAAMLVPLTFAIVFATVIAHGFSIGWLSRKLGLSTKQKPGILLVGASPWSIGLGAALKDLEIPATIVDTNWHRLREVRLAGLSTYYGQILSEAAEFHLDMNRFGYLLALTENDSYNALVCSQFSPEIGRHRVYQLGSKVQDEEDHKELAFTIRGRTLLRSGTGYYELVRRRRQGWIFQKTRLTEEYGLERYLSDRPEGTEMLFAVRPSGAITFSTDEGRPPAKAGDVILSYSPPPSAEKAANKRKSNGTGA